MTTDEHDHKFLEELRQRAEGKVRESLPGDRKETDARLLHLVQELQIHQVELEMQNEELRRTQAELEESRSEYADLYDHAPVGYLTLDPKGLILRANLTAAALLLDEPAGLEGYPLLLRIHREDRHAFHKHLLQAFESSGPATVELRLLRKNGEVFQVRLESIFVQENLNRPEYRTSIIDIAERKQAEKESQQALGALERSNRELEQFAYIASHDLREPLRSISGFMDLLRRRYQGRLDREADEFIDYAVEGAGRLDRMIRDLLEYSRLQLREPELRPVDLFEVYLETVERLYLLIKQSGAHITHAPLPEVRGDKAQLIRLFQNLLANAINYRRQGKLRIHIAVERQEDRWLVSVRDNGIGIQTESQERVFLVFTRLHHLQESPGTGMGLSICKKIVEHHGGSIWVGSKPGKGSTFFFTLPQK